MYICTGTCEAKISEEEFKNGLTACGTEGCTHKGHTFEKRLECHVCGKLYKEDENHTHV